MPEITLEPFEEEKNERVLPPIEPVSDSTIVLPAIDIVPDPVFQPEVDPDLPVGGLGRIEVHPNFFDDIGRVHKVGVVSETISTGADILEPRPQGVDPDLQMIDQIMRMPKSQWESPNNPLGRPLDETDRGTIFGELAGTLETAAGGFIQGGINFIEYGLTSAAALWKALENGPGIKITDDGGIEFTMDVSPGRFVDDFISTQGKIAAAYGEFYSYDPLLDTSRRNMTILEETGEWVDDKLQRSSEALGRTTLEGTGSPELATAAHLLPQAALYALPFLGAAGIRQRMIARQDKRLKDFKEQVRLANQGPIERNMLRMEVLEASEPSLVGGVELPKGTVSIRLYRDDDVGHHLMGNIDLIPAGDELRVTNLFLDSQVQGRGVSRQLFQTVIDAARERGYKALSSDTIVSKPASAVIEFLNRRGTHRVEKNPTAELVKSEEVLATLDTESVQGVPFKMPGEVWVSGNGQPIYRVILDEPAATSTLSAPTKMSVRTLQALAGERPTLDAATIQRIATDVKTGRASGEVIVETVQGTPTRIISGAEYVQAIPIAAAEAGLNVKNLKVRFQERESLTDADRAMLEQQARQGLKDIIENQRKLDAVESSQSRSILQRVIRMFADTSGNVKAEILKRLGPAGEAAVQSFSLMAGAVPKAHMMFQDFKRRVYGHKGQSDPGLSFRKDISYLGVMMSEVELFNILVQSRRTQAIVKAGGAKASKTGRFQLSGAVRPENAAGNIYAIRKTLGEERFAQLQARADDVFDTMHAQLIRLRENGLISQAEFLRMQNIDYIKREFLQEIDPTLLYSQIKGTKVSIGESGIYHLKGGSGRAQNIDVQSLVAEYLARTEARIFRNNANKALYKAALENPENGLVYVPGISRKRSTEGYTELKVLIDGEKRSMWMKDLYAAEWVISDPGLAMAISNVFQIINGTFIVKPLATGINPAFALVNFPRDIMHAWKATGNEYSSFLPLYLGQIFSDIVTVSKDVWKKEGRYRDFINEGGGMNFLAHGGFDPLSGFSKQKDTLRAVGVHRGEFGRRWTRAKEVLSKVNEFSELAVRLAIRERVLKNQAERGEIPNPQEATFIARDYLDFSQGGSVTKAIEGFIPYTNAASQAIRTAYREYLRGRRAASAAALKDLQVVGLKASLSAWAWMENPEAMAQVDPHASYTNYMFPTGLSYVDDRGNRRHLMIPIAMDTTVLPFTALFDRAVTKHSLLATGIDPSDVPSGHLLESLASVVPILGSIRTGTPTFQAAAALWANKDLWANRDIWQGDPFVMPGARRSESTEGTMFETLGSAFPKVVSPVQLQKAWRTYVPSNFYLDSADFLRQQIQKASDPVARAEMMQQELSDLTLEIMSKVPGLNRLVYVTHPAAQTTEELRVIAERVATWHEIERQAVDRAVRKYMALGDSSDFSALLERVATVRPQDAETVKDLLVTRVVTDMMYKNNKYDIGFVGEDWFNSLAGKDPEIKAELYYLKYITLSDENLRNLDAVISQIDKLGGRRIRTERFEQHLARIIAQSGTREQRLRIVDDGR